MKKRERKRERERERERERAHERERKREKERQRETQRERERERETETETETETERQRDRERVHEREKERERERNRQTERERTLTSFPKGNVLPREEHNPTTLDTRVRNVRYSFSTTPRNIVFISGMPDPSHNEKFVLIMMLSQTWLPKGIKSFLHSHSRQKDLRVDYHWIRYQQNACDKNISNLAAWHEIVFFSFLLNYDTRIFFSFIHYA